MGLGVAGECTIVHSLVRGRIQGSATDSACMIVQMGWRQTAGWPIVGITMHDRASKLTFPLVLAAAVRQRRKDLDLKQVELAELAGCSTRFLHTVEAGKATIRLDKLLPVLRVLGLELEVQRAGAAGSAR